MAQAVCKRKKKFDYLLYLIKEIQSLIKRTLLDDREMMKKYVIKNILNMEEWHVFWNKPRIQILWGHLKDREEKTYSEDRFKFTHTREYAEKLSAFIEKLNLIDLNETLKKEHTNIKEELLSKNVVYRGTFNSNDFHGSWGHYNPSWHGTDPTLIAINELGVQSNPMEIHIQLRPTDDYIPSSWKSSSEGTWFCTLSI